MACAVISVAVCTGDLRENLMTSSAIRRFHEDISASDTKVNECTCHKMYACTKLFSVDRYIDRRTLIYRKEENRSQKILAKDKCNRCWQELNPAMLVRSLKINVESV